MLRSATTGTAVATPGSGSTGFSRGHATRDVCRRWNPAGASGVNGGGGWSHVGGSGNTRERATSSSSWNTAPSMILQSGAERQAPSAADRHIAYNKEIVRQRSARGIIELCERHVGEFNYVNVVTAVHRIAKAPDAKTVLGHRQMDQLGSLISDGCRKGLGNVNPTPQGLANTIWAYARLRVRLEPILDSIASACLGCMSEFSSQNLANLSWSVSTLQYRNEPLLQAVSNNMVERTGDCDPRHLGNTAWALATLSCCHDPVLECIASAAIARCDEFNGQGLANTAWAFAQFRWHHEPLFTVIAERASRTDSCGVTLLDMSRPQELANLVWSFATLSHLDVPLVKAVSGACRGKLWEFVPQDHANITWSFAILRESGDKELRDALGTAAVESINKFEPQHLVNTAWAFATLRWKHSPLMRSIAEQSRLRLRDHLPHAMASLAWAFARLDCGRQAAPLFDDIAGVARHELGRRRGAPSQRLSERNVGMLLWAFSHAEAAGEDTVTTARAAAGRPSLAAKGSHGGAAFAHGRDVVIDTQPPPWLARAWSLLETSMEAGQRLDGLSIGGVAMACQRRQCRHWEAALLEKHLARGAIRLAALNVTAMILAENGEASRALALLDAATREGLFNAVSRRVWLACGGAASRAEELFDEPSVEPGEPYAKELSLMRHVLATATPGDPASVCAAVESFGSGTLPETSQWLKVAGGAKADVLRDSAAPRPSGRAPRGGLAIEIGTYCGYSALHITEVRDPPAHHGAPCLLSLEVDAAHAAVARNILAFAGAAHRVEVLTGHSEDVLPTVVERLQRRGRKVDFVFLDQRGSRYDADLGVLERGGVLADGAVVVADNVLKPGAPLFLWVVSRRGARYETEVVSLPEFAMAEVEDWMTVSTYSAPVGEGIDGFAEVAVVGSPVAMPTPLSVRLLEWQAEQMRARTHNPDRGGGGVGFLEWADFAAAMRIGMLESTSEGVGGGNFTIRSAWPAAAKLPFQVANLRDSGVRSVEVGSVAGPSAAQHVSSKMATAAPAPTTCSVAVAPTLPSETVGSEQVLAAPTTTASTDASSAAPAAHRSPSATTESELSDEMWVRLGLHAPYRDIGGEEDIMK
eukprot:TRINITY_DN36648_c0_g1_i1.p1 TRINITY_DN36648_c0_g1~~TRINITY_DN36648_c0_g1_i1.p1  ORF type:complete len:1099 (-),score=193.23 TRINITY_DN36648_c0_g1_i1:8-3304(-)